MIFHVNCLLADNSHEIACLIKAAKFEIVIYGLEPVILMEM